MIALGITSGAARADVPPFRQSDDEAVPAKVERSAPLPLRVVRDPRAEHQRIVIPAKLLAGLVASQPGDTSNTSTHLRSIIAATALSAAVAAGLVLVRSRRRTPGQRWLLSLCGLVSLVTAVAVNTAFADLLPPGGGPRRPRPTPLREDDSAERPAAGTIVIEITPGGEEILLLLGRNGLPPQ